MTVYICDYKDYIDNNEMYLHFNINILTIIYNANLLLDKRKKSIDYFGGILSKWYNDNNVNQLTKYGISKLKLVMENERAGVFYRSGHFYTILKKDDNL